MSVIIWRGSFLTSVHCSYVPEFLFGNPITAIKHHYVMIKNIFYRNVLVYLIIKTGITKHQCRNFKKYQKIFRL